MTSILGQRLSLSLLLFCVVDAAAAPIQSPIDIRSDNTIYAGLPALTFAYDSAVALDVFNNGSPDEESTVRANVPAGAGTLMVGGSDYALTQFHFHSESEHLINGVNAPMELHMVHQTIGGDLLVVGRLIEFGLTNTLLDPIFSNLPMNPGDTLPLASFDLNGLLPGDLSSFRYTGSLTTPPFTEGVSWIILAEPLELSAEQIDGFRSLFPSGNERLPQDLNGRVILTDVVGFSSVPEPGSVTLFSIALIGLAGWRIRGERRRAA